MQDLPFVKHSRPLLLHTILPSPNFLRHPPDHRIIQTRMSPRQIRQVVIIFPTFSRQIRGILMKIFMRIIGIDRVNILIGARGVGVSGVLAVEVAGANVFCR